MHTVLGLSLKSDDVAWALLDTADGTVIDHDALQSQGDAETAVAAVRSAHAIAKACGFEVDRVRLTWTADAAREGLRLRARLGRLGFGDIESVPMACATTVLVDPGATDITPRVALAYGAALAVVEPSEAIAAPVVKPTSKHSRRIVSSGLGVAAAVAVGLLCLSAGAPTQFQPPSTTAEGHVRSDAGWATVPVPSDVTATPMRKVVVTPSYVESPSTVPAQANVAVRAVAPTAPEPTPTPAETPHLSGASPSAGPVSGLTDSVSSPTPEPDITEVVNALVALP